MAIERGLLGGGIWATVYHLYACSLQRLAICDGCGTAFGRWGELARGFWLGVRGYKEWSVVGWPGPAAGCGRSVRCKL